MNCRKNVKNLSPTEKSDLVQAFLDLKDPARAPSLIAAAQARGATSRYDDYIWLHTIVNLAAHRRPGFLAWHRKYLDLFEIDLQNVSGKPHLALPYWDWADLAGSNPFTADFLGGPGTNPSDIVTTGAFAHANGDWNLTVPSEDAISIDPELKRRVVFGSSTVGQLPTHQEVRDLLEITPLDASPWSDTSTLASFRNRLEGWFGGSPVEFHNAGHVYVGGSMSPDNSPQDPVFWLHHCNVDRLWAVWQQKHPAEPYAPDASESNTLNGHRLGDDLGLFTANFGTAYTVDSVLDHKAAGYMYDTDIPSVVLETPSIDFGNVPEGLTTYHAVRFRVETCRRVEFEITAGLSGNFSQTPVSIFTADPVPGDPFVYGYVFIAYTAPSSGIIESSNVSIRAYFTDTEGFYSPSIGDEYTLLTVNVDLFATPVPIQKTAVALVLDRSGSMAGTAITNPAGTPTSKFDLLQDAVATFSTLMRSEDGIGVVSYDDIVDRLLDITKMGPHSPINAGSGRAEVNTILAGPDLNPRGATGIGAGIIEGNDVLSDGQTAASSMSPPDPYDTLAMVVMTDGNENQTPSISDISASISANTFAVGLGTAGNVSESALEAIVMNNDGDLLVTGDMNSQVKTFFLTKLFVQILAGITNQQVILDPYGQLVIDAVHRIPFDVSEADVELSVIALSQLPQVLDFSIESPNGKVFTRKDISALSNFQYVEERKTAFYRITLPGLKDDPEGSHAGKWHAILKFDSSRLKELLDKESETFIEFIRNKSKSISYNVIVQTRSNLTMSASATQDGFKPGAKVSVFASLQQYNQALPSKVDVIIEITGPGNLNKILKMAQTSTGTYETSFVTKSKGTYNMRLIATGRTIGGEKFTREKVLTKTVHFTSGQMPTSPKYDDQFLCKLLACVFSEKVTDDRFEERLKDWGINLEALKECMKRACNDKKDLSARDKISILKDTVSKKGGDAAAALASSNEMRTLISEMLIRSEIVNPQLIARRPKELEAVKKQEEVELGKIPSEGFFTKPMSKIKSRKPKGK